MSDRARLHPDDVAAIAEATARRVIEMLREGERAGLWMTAAEVARRLGVSADWVREHRDDLGAVRLGSGRRPRLRFDRERVEAALTSRGNSVPSHCASGSGGEPKAHRTTVARAGIALDSLPIRELQPRPSSKDRPGAAATARGTASRRTP